MSNLLLFNMKMDIDDGVLGFTTDWVNGLARHFDQIFVVTHSAGKIQVNPNVHVFSVGREKGYSKIRRLFEFYRIVSMILKRNRIDYCFVHMIQLFAILAAPLMKLRRIPVTMWYGHQATPLSLRLAHALVDKIVTSTPSGFQIPSTKKVCVGQGITESKFPLRQFREKQKPYIVVNVSRLSPSKNIHALIEAVGLFTQKHGKNAIRLNLVGDALNERDCLYKTSLHAIVQKYDIAQNVIFCGSIAHSKIYDSLAASDLSTNLAPADGSVDKAALESMAMGVPILLQNRSFRAIFEEAQISPDQYIVPDVCPETLVSFLEQHVSSDALQEYEHLKSLSQHIHEKHGLNGLAERISREIRST